MVNTNWIMGLWKFAGQVELSRILEAANDLAKAEPQYVQIYVRKSSKQQYSIGFAYNLNSDEAIEMRMNTYIEKTEQWLRSHFGNELIGHDIAAPIYLIK